MKKFLWCLMLLAPVSAFAEQPTSLFLSLTDRGLWSTEARRVSWSELLTIAVGRHANFSGQAAVMGNISDGMTILPKLGLKLRLFF